MASSINYRKEIDGLRAIAVIVVIINHFNKEFLPSGYLGVDIFFVISGFVITASLANRESKGFWDFILSFYERRIKRLVPALAFFVLVSGILICLVNPFPGLSLFTGITALFGVSNFYLYSHSTDYFAESSQLNVFTHTWSLGVEEQFYFIFPLLIWFSGFVRNTKNGQRNFILLITFLASISLATFVYLSQNNVSASYFLMPPRFWEMASGSIFYFVSKRKKINDNYLTNLNPNLIFFTIFPLFFLPVSANVIATMLIVLLTNIFILSIREDFIIYKVLTQKYVVFIGLLSYSLYLWHWGILSISSWTIGIYWWSIPIQILLIVLISFFSYNFIEKPLRNSSWLNKKYFSLFFGTSIIFFSTLFLIVLGKPLKQVLAKINNTINPSTYKYYPAATDGLECDMPKNITNAIDDCLKVDNNFTNKGNVYLIGDSHAANHYYSIKNNLPSNKYSEFRSILEWGLIHSLQGENCINSPCIKNSWPKYLNFFEENLSPKDVIVFSWARDRIVKNRNEELVREPDQKKLNILKEKLIELIYVIKKRKSKLILVDDIPKVCPDTINFRQLIITRGKIEKCVIDKSITLEDRKPMTLLFKELSKKDENIFYFDPHDFLCKETKCDLMDSNNKMLYNDASPHFSSQNPEPLLDEWKLLLKNI